MAERTAPAGADRAGSVDRLAADSGIIKTRQPAATVQPVGSARSARQGKAFGVANRGTPGQGEPEQSGGSAGGDAAGRAAGGGTAGLAVRDNESPWTVQELDAVRAELTAAMTRIAGEVQTLETAIADMMRDSGDGAGDDQADSGSKAFEREQGMTLLANTRETLFQTEHALRRIEDGTYGSCESCGNPIGKLRLQAFPRATLCVACKQRQERR